MPIVMKCFILRLLYYLYYLYRYIYMHVECLMEFSSCICPFVIKTKSLKCKKPTCINNFKTLSSKTNVSKK